MQMPVTDIQNPLCLKSKLHLMKGFDRGKNECRNGLQSVKHYIQGLKLSFIHACTYSMYYPLYVMHIYLVS